MPSWYTVAAAIIFILLIALLAGADKAHSASVTICKPIQTTIKLPKAGKCRTYSVGGYKVTVCG